MPIKLQFLVLATRCAGALLLRVNFTSHDRRVPRSVCLR
jgi:hypothetical protein